MKLRKAKSAKQAHALSPTEQEWQRVARLRSRNQRLEAEMQAFEQECIEALRPAEERMSAALLEQTRHLSTFATRMTLVQWQRAELIDWIQENVELLGGGALPRSGGLRAVSAKGRGQAGRCCGRIGSRNPHEGRRRRRVRQ